MFVCGYLIVGFGVLFDAVWGLRLVIYLDFGVMLADGMGVR